MSPGVQDFVNAMQSGYRSHDRETAIREPADGDCGAAERDRLSSLLQHSFLADPLPSCVRQVLQNEKLWIIACLGWAWKSTERKRGRLERPS